MKNKLIRDSIHGYIEIPEIIVNKIIDTPVFQRLRQIEQTSMRALYPSAHHDRFVHSLGVYHLGKMAYSGLISNIIGKPFFGEFESFWVHYGVCFEIACLLHDCGHAPMSHSFEYAYLQANNPDDVRNKKDRLHQSMICGLDPDDRDAFDQIKADVERYFSNPKLIAPHEMVSAILVSEYFGQVKGTAGLGAIHEVLTSILGEDVSSSQLAEYISFIQRAIIGLTYSDRASTSDRRRAENHFKNCLISLLNGNFFDVDKLDYIVRDTVESGANNLSIDIPRILSALTLVEIHQFEKETHVQDLSLNNSIYFSGCNSTVYDKEENSDCECALNLEGVHLVGSFQGTMELKGSNNTLTTPDSDGHRSGKSRFDIMTQIDANIANVCKLTGRFNGRIEMLNFPKPSKIDGLINARVSGKITGEIVGNIDTSLEHKITYKVGYLKTAISVIEDTLIARNRLYLWIYAHHKVTYNDYILRNGILRSFLTRESAQIGVFEQAGIANALLSSAMSIDDMFFADRRSPNYLLNDGDLIHQMKVSLIAEDVENPFAKQWLSRAHMHPIWKSYAEYNSFFANLSLSQRKKMWQLLFDVEPGAEGRKLPTEANTLEFGNSVLKTFRDDCSFTWIQPAGFKVKEMDVSNIYIVLSDSSVKRLKDVMTQPKVTEQYVDESFFYLYASKPLSPEAKLQLISHLKRAINK